MRGAEVRRQASLALTEERDRLASSDLSKRSGGVTNRTDSLYPSQTDEDEL